LQLAFAATLMQSIPDNLKESLRSSFGARAYCYGILLDKDEEIRQKQVKHLAIKADEKLVITTTIITKLFSLGIVKFRIICMENFDLDSALVEIRNLIKHPEVLDSWNREFFHLWIFAQYVRYLCTYCANNLDFT
jgi:hypothetical protein